MLKISGETEDTFRIEEALGNRNVAMLIYTSRSILNLVNQGLLQILHIRFGVLYHQLEYRKPTKHTQTHTYTCSLTYTHVIGKTCS